MAVDVCGQKLFLAVTFEEENQSDYYDEMNEWKIQEYEEQVNLADDKLANLIYLSNENAVNLKVTFLSLSPIFM